MNPKLFKTNLALLRAEIRKAWSRPILELSVALVAIVSITTVQPLLNFATQNNLQSTFTKMAAGALYSCISTQMLPLVILCGILVSLSFARDYEQGLMQTILSAPISRSSLFIIKFVAIVLPLALVSWGVTVFALVINYNTGTFAVFTILGISGWALLITFLALMFYGGLATLISLTIRRTIPSALTSMLAGFFVWYITTLKVDAIGDLANYLVLTPFQAPLTGLNKILNASILAPGTLESTLPSWGFVGLTLFYAFVLLVPMYFYFTRRFEVRE